MIEWTDRYQALGMPYPNPETMCGGQCEGTGFVPIARGDVGECLGISQPEEPFLSLWLEAEKTSPSDDGWHFVRCPDCNGEGKK